MLHLLHPVGVLEGLVDPLHDHRDAVHGVERLVGIHLARGVRVGRDLPARKIDSLEPGADILDRLVTRVGAEGRDEFFVRQQAPETRGAALGQGVRNLDRV